MYGNDSGATSAAATGRLEPKSFRGLEGPGASTNGYANELLYQDSSPDQARSPNLKKPVSDYNTPAPVDAS